MSTPLTNMAASPPSESFVVSPPRNSRLQHPSYAGMMPAVAAYGYPPRNHHHEMMMTKQHHHVPQDARRSSPTSVMFDATHDPVVAASYSGVDASYSSPTIMDRHHHHTSQTDRHHAAPTPVRLFEENQFTGVQPPSMMCIPCNNKSSPADAPAPVSVQPVAIKTNNAPVSSSPRPTPSSSSSSRRSSRGPNFAGGTGGDRPSGGGSGNNGGIHPTPQNLRDNPDRLAKVKTVSTYFVIVCSYLCCMLPE